MSVDDDSLDFIEESGEDSAVGRDRPLPPWRILIVDDDEDVHQSTVFALRDALILGRPIEFLHSHSASEAMQLLEQASDIALILLDVVMETDDAGLTLIGHIREGLGLSSVRIILRTGQPGYAPDVEAITRYDINDYKTKAELSRSRLFTAATAAIRSYDQITHLEASRRGLEYIVDSTNHFVADQGLPAFATSVIGQVSALLGSEANGLLLVRRNAESESVNAEQDYVTLAAAGRLNEYAKGVVLGAISDHDVRGRLLDALDAKRITFGADWAVLYFYSRNSGDFVAYVQTGRQLREVDRHLLGVFCANVSIRADNIDLVSKLRETAYEDRLTCLPNRMAMIEDMENRLQRGWVKGMVVALVDIDQFSEMIDILGYRYGDRILFEMSRRLRGSLPTDVFVARVGSDVFGIFGTEDVANPALLREILSDPLVIDDGAQTVSISLGFVRVAEDMQSGADLLRYAAIALKRAKAEGVGRESYYTPEVAIETRERVRMLQDLRMAFSNDRLFVVFQPQVELPSGRPLGVEALLRWRTEEGKFIPPDKFIPVAEQSGLIVSLGAWVLRTSLNTLNDLISAGYPLRMAVNVSAIQFRHPGFLDMVDRVLAETGTPPNLLELEITESVAMFGQADFESRLVALRARGIGVAIDDFGTGFSSLSYLDRLGASCLKIDRSFVLALHSGRPGARIAEMVIGLGGRLGMRVLAEGVETPEQVDLLSEMGCDEAQGWFYGKGVVQEELMQWLEQKRS
ncbi:MAG: hypothetical protein H6R18_1026 [Proteobacteria bacterium]|nr:hypothetical protein [Pseudomonadota bacterium]